jgi:TusA-related sulfurtransferase
MTESEGGVHCFDAGELGFGTGLPRELRALLDQIAVGQFLEVVTRDPSAREDLPSMSRMLGHRVRSVDSGPEGNTLTTVERLS